MRILREGEEGEEEDTEAGGSDDDVEMETDDSDFCCSGSKLSSLIIGGRGISFSSACEYELIRWKRIQILL